MCRPYLVNIMRALIVVLIIHFSSLSISAYCGKSTSPLEALPPCALSCILTASTKSPCEITDFECACKDVALQTRAEKCVLQSCTLKEALETKNITSSLCKLPLRNNSGSLKTLIISLLIPSKISVLSRVVGKFAGLSNGFGIDDACLVIAMCLGLSTVMLVFLGAIPAGLGRDIWTLSFSSVTDFARFFYFIEIFYFLSLTFVKLSFLFFYKRIFAGNNVTKIIWATILFNILFGLAFSLAAVFVCRPISYSWKNWDGPKTDGRCINNNALVWANGGVSVAVDFWMLAIPLSQVIHLQMKSKKKIALGLMFVVGTFVTIVSIIRLHSLVGFADSQNPTWDQRDTTYWSTVELNLGIICACMPMYRVFLILALRKVLGSTTNSPDDSYRNRARNNLMEERGRSLVGPEMESNSREVWVHDETGESFHVETQYDHIQLVIPGKKDEPRLYRIV